MQGPDLIYIVMPVVILLALVVLIALPFAAATGSGDRRSAGRHSGGQEPLGQMPGHPATTDAVGGDVADLGHGRPSVTVRAHVPSTETIVSGGTAGNANASRVTKQLDGGRSRRS